MACIRKTWMGRSGSSNPAGDFDCLATCDAAIAIIFRSGGVVLQSLLRLPYAPLRQASTRLPEAVICSRAHRRRVMIAVVFPERRASQFDLRPALFLELLHSMFLAVGDSLCKRHRTRHANMSEGDKECLFFVQRNEVAHDTAFITSIRQIRDGAVRLNGVSKIFGLKLFNHLWC